jgi:hypothetical protein
VVVQAAGGFGSLQGMGLYHQRIDLLAYGPTALKADELHEKCMSVLNVLSDSYQLGIMLCNAELENGGNADKVPNTTGNGPNWPFVISTWGIESLFEGVE